VPDDITIPHAIEFDILLMPVGARGVSSTGWAQEGWLLAEMGAAFWLWLGRGPLPSMKFSAIREMRRAATRRPTMRNSPLRLPEKHT
jgi:hypothetical protein